MGKSAPSAPAAPDPQVTAAAQTQSNLATAQQQSVLNNANQYTPYGSLTYSQPGGAGTQWNVQQTLSPAEQNLLNLSQQAQTTYGNMGNAELSQAAQTLSTPINTDYSQVRNQYIQSQMGLLQPQLAQQQQALQSQLQNQGVAQGSDAWNNAMRSFTMSQNQAYADVLANAQQGVGAAIQQQESLRDQPLNEVSALLTGQQVNPGAQLTSAQTQVQPTDVLGAYQQSLNQQDFNYQQQMANYSSGLGGAAGLLGTLGGAALMHWSDRALKTDEKEVGRLMLPGGELPIKTFRYHGDQTPRIGFVAQDVERVDPGSVFQDPGTGLKGVHYARVLSGAHLNTNGRRKAA